MSINPKVHSKADLVILAVPAPEVLRLAPELPAALRAALRQIRYDGRVAVALTLEHATYPAVHRRTNGKILDGGFQSHGSTPKSSKIGMKTLMLRNPHGSKPRDFSGEHKVVAEK